MSSLRARLIAAVLVLTAVGLLALASITYALQRSFLFDRVDQQARAAGPVLAHTLGVHDFRPRGGAAGGFRPGEGDDAHRGPPGEGATLPPGTYGERRDADADVVRAKPYSYGQTALAPPKIPRHLEPGRLTTVGARGDSGLHYRVVALRSRDGDGTIVAAIPLRDVEQTLSRLLLVEGLVIAGVLLALAVLGWFVVRLGLRPLDRIGQTAGAIAAGDLGRRVSPATEKTEVGRLGLALNAMLARLEQAFAQRRASEDSLRRFLADASHELRTPLSSIRGYAELFRMGATADPRETARAMERIEQEAARMGVLVEDLLTLARLGEVREPVRERVDLAALARDAADDARASAPDRPVDVDGPADAVVSGDANQLHQVVANLLRNAVAHTPAGTPIEVGVRRDGGDVELAVRDHGPGLPAGDPALLFERFWRAREGRERGPAGAGLGLAIVAGIVEAHGGAVRAADAEGGGARFVVRLPLAVPAEAAAPAVA
jgi:two-component system, OmpR family, sensor kinase